MPDLSKLSDDELMRLHSESSGGTKDLSKLSDNELIALHKEASAKPDDLKSGIGDSALRGAAQGATLGFADELTAGAGAVKDWASGKLGLRGGISIPDAYGTYIDKIRGKDAEARKEHPIAYGVGEIAGGTATGSLIPVINPAAKVGAAARIGTAAAAGAGTGAGQSQNNPFRSWDELVGFGGDAAKGAAVGGATQGLLDKVTPAIASRLRDTAEQRAFKAAVGNQQKVYDDAVKQGRVNDIGRDLLDYGVVGFGDKARTISGKADAARKVVGQEMGDLLAHIDSKAEGVVDGGSIAQRIRDYAGSIHGEGNSSTSQKLNAIADAYETKGPMSLVQAQVEKNSFKYRPGDPGATFDKEAINRVKGIIGDEMERGIAEYQAMGLSKTQAAEAVATGTGPSRALSQEGQAVLRDAAPAESASETYQSLKRNYGSFKTAGTAAEKLGNRQDKNRTLSLTDYLMGGLAGGATLNPGVGLGIAIANKLARERGSSALAVSADKVANVLERAPDLGVNLSTGLNQVLPGGTDSAIKRRLQGGK